jgi:hypothetical protein
MLDSEVTLFSECPDDLSCARLQDSYGLSGPGHFYTAERELEENSLLVVFFLNNLLLGTSSLSSPIFAPPPASLLTHAYAASQLGMYMLIQLGMYGNRSELSSVSP